jgi:hypothetical protein
MCLCLARILVYVVNTAVALMGLAIAAGGLLLHRDWTFGTVDSRGADLVCAAGAVILLGGVIGCCATKHRVIFFVHALILLVSAAGAGFACYKIANWSHTLSQAQEADKNIANLKDEGVQTIINTTHDAFLSIYNTSKCSPIKNIDSNQILPELKCNDDGEWLSDYVDENCKPEYCKQGSKSTSCFEKCLGHPEKCQDYLRSQVSCNTHFGFAKGVISSVYYCSCEPSILSYTVKIARVLAWAFGAIAGLQVLILICTGCILRDSWKQERARQVRALETREISAVLVQHRV